MDLLGLYLLGIFVGTIACLGIKYMDSLANWKEGLTIALTSTLVGTAVTAVDKFGEDSTHSKIGTYCLGLFVALLWYYMRENGMALIRSVSEAEVTELITGSRTTSPQPSEAATGSEESGARPAKRTLPPNVASAMFAALASTSPVPLAELGFSIKQPKRKVTSTPRWDTFLGWMQLAATVLISAWSLLIVIHAATSPIWPFGSK